MHNITNFDVDFLLDLYGDNVILSMTDTKGIIKYVSDAYVEISEYSRDELIGKSQNIVRHPDMPSSIFKELWQTISSGKTWKGEIKNLKKYKDFYWVKATVTPHKDENGTIIGYASVRQDITDKKKAILLHTQIQNILNNIEDGFLTFDKNFTIQESYSKNCLNILHQNNIAKKNIAEVLFENDKDQKETFLFGCEQLFQTDSLDTKEIYLSLLPHKHYNNGILFTINYKILPDNNILLLLRDITNQTELESEIKYKQKMQNMFITIATHKEEAIELIQSFKHFLQNDLKNLATDKLKMKLHTFKGLFSQLEMVNTIDSIHEIETHLKNNTQTKEHRINLANVFHQDIQMITDSFGELFLSPTSTIKVELNQIDTIESELQILIDKEKDNKPKLFEILEAVRHLKDQSLLNMLKVHEITVANIAKAKNKNIYPLEIIGSKDILVSAEFKNFTKTLVHIFSNSIIHGIEDLEIRKKYNKNTKGKIVCKFKLHENNIILNISDNGQGIDTDKVIKKAIELDLTTKEKVLKLKNQEILQFIFSNDFSMVNNIDEFSGRGIGLASVKYELLQLDGSVYIQNDRFKGLSYQFTIPYKKDVHNDAIVIANTILIKTKKFLYDDLSIKIHNTFTTENINTNKYYSTIQLSGVNNVLFSFLMDEQLVEKAVQYFIHDKDAINLNKLQENVTAEVLNILLGLSVPQFPQSYRQLKLGTPTILDNTILETFMQNNQSNLIHMETEFGNLELLIIVLNNTN